MLAFLKRPTLVGPAGLSLPKGSLTIGTGKTRINPHTRILQWGGEQFQGPQIGRWMIPGFFPSRQLAPFSSPHATVTD